MLHTNLFKIIIFNFLVLSSVVVGLFYHIIQPIFLNDASGMSYIIAIFMFSIVIFSIYESIWSTKWIIPLIKFEEKNLYLLGLVGTLIGLITLVGVIGNAVGAGSDNSELLGKVLVGFASGMRTSFNPTLTGIVCWIWTRHLLFFMNGKNK